MAQSIPEAILNWLDENRDEIERLHGEDVYQRAVDGDISRGDLAMLLEENVLWR